MTEAHNRAADTITVFVSIGNSDDKLSQQDWHRFFADVDGTLRAAVGVNATAFYGTWTSIPIAPYQNACWAFEKPDREAVAQLRTRLTEVAAQFGQNSIAWAEATTEFLRPTPPAYTDQQSTQE